MEVAVSVRLSWRLIPKGPMNETAAVFLSEPTGTVAGETERAAENLDIGIPGDSRYIRNEINSDSRGRDVTKWKVPICGRAGGIEIERIGKIDSGGGVAQAGSKPCAFISSCGRMHHSQIAMAIDLMNYSLTRFLPFKVIFFLTYHQSIAESYEHYEAMARRK